MGDVSLKRLETFLCPLFDYTIANNVKYLESISFTSFELTGVTECRDIKGTYSSSTSVM